MSALDNSGQKGGEPERSEAIRGEPQSFCRWATIHIGHQTTERFIRIVLTLQSCVKIVQLAGNSDVQATSVNVRRGHVKNGSVVADIPTDTGSPPDLPYRTGIGSKFRSVQC